MEAPKAEPLKPASSLSLSDKDKFEYAWKHYDFIADQRIRTFNFYAILLTASLTATVSLIDRIKESIGVELAVGFWHLLIGSAFLVMDIRSRRLLEIPKQALIYFESAQDWTSPKLILEGENRASKAWRLVSYSSAIRSTCGAQMIFGFAAILHSFWQISQILRCACCTGCCGAKW